jgi:hypothetical protein
MEHSDGTDRVRGELAEGAVVAVGHEVVSALCECSDKSVACDDTVEGCKGFSGELGFPDPGFARIVLLRPELDIMHQASSFKLQVSAIYSKPTRSST